MSTDSSNSPENDTVVVDSDFTFRVHDGGVIIDCDDLRSVVSCNAATAVQMHHALAEHIDALINKSRHVFQADLWEKGAAVAARLAGDGVDIYHLTLEWDPTYATRHAEIVVNDPATVRFYATREVEQSPIGTSAAIRTQTEVADNVLLVSSHYPPKTADAAQASAPAGTEAAA